MRRASAAHTLSIKAEQLCRSHAGLHKNISPYISNVIPREMAPAVEIDHAPLRPFNMLAQKHYVAMPYGCRSRPSFRARKYADPIPREVKALVIQAEISREPTSAIRGGTTAWPAPDYGSRVAIGIH